MVGLRGDEGAVRLFGEPLGEGKLKDWQRLGETDRGEVEVISNARACDRYCNCSIYNGMT